MDFEYRHRISEKDIFQEWVIRTYLHRREYNILYVLSKILPPLLLIINGTPSTYNLILYIVVFFYFEVYILYRFIFIKRRVKALYGNKREAVIEFKRDEIIFKSSIQSSTVKWNEITAAIERKWFFFLYKGKVVVSSIYKRPMPNNDIMKIRKYFSEQAKLGRNITLRK